MLRRDIGAKELGSVWTNVPNNHCPHVQLVPLDPKASHARLGVNQKNPAVIIAQTTFWASAMIDDLWTSGSGVNRNHLWLLLSQTFGKIHQNREWLFGQITRQQLPNDSRIVLVRGWKRG